jgi:hypothetical protein
LQSWQSGSAAVGRPRLLLPFSIVSPSFRFWSTDNFILACFRHSVKRFLPKNHCAKCRFFETRIL